MKKVVHIKTGFIFGEKIEHANSFAKRLIGLMFRKEMGKIDGMLLEPGNSIHNCFVRFPIDVLFLDRKNKIVKIIYGFKPWRFSWIYFKATKVLELPAGKIPSNIHIGDEVEVSDV